MNLADGVDRRRTTVDERWTSVTVTGRVHDM
jgi:hypothetical protein